MKRLLILRGWRTMFWLWVPGMTAMLVSVNTYGQLSQHVRLTEQEVACQPAGDWLYQFPAISQSDDGIAVLTEPDPESGIVSLQVLRVLDQDLRLELEFPLFLSQYVNWKECVEEIETGTRKTVIGSPEIITAANVHLSTNGFSAMFPLDARSVYGVTIDTLPTEPEEVISWSRYHISVDYRQSNVTVNEFRGNDNGILAATEYGVGQRYFGLQLSKKEEPGGLGAAESCIGFPVPLAVWTNQERNSPGNEVFLLRIGYVSSEGCDFPDEWIVKAVDR